MLFFLLFALISGIISGYYFTFPYFGYILSALVLFLLPAIFWSFIKKFNLLSLTLVIFLIFFVGFLNIEKTQYLISKDNHIIHYVNSGKHVWEGVVVDNPVFETDRTVLIVRCIRIVDRDSYIRVYGNIRLVAPPDIKFEYGDFIRFHSSIKKMSSFQNPGGFNYERYMNLKNIYASGFVSDDSQIIILRNNAAGTAKAKLEKYRINLKKLIYENTTSPQREIIEAMILGNKRNIPSDIRELFNKTGAAHLLAISGLHVGMVAVAAFFLFSFLLKRSEYLLTRFNVVKIASAGAFIFVLIYAFIAGMGITVFRATLMALAFLIALIFSRHKDIYNILAVTALFILIFWPEALFDVSFQLSFSAVLSIVYFIPRLSINDYSLFASWPKWIQTIIKKIYSLIIVCIAATIGTMPLIVFYFNRASSIAVLANLVAVPLLGAIALPLSLVFIITSSFSPAIGGFFVKSAALFIQMTIAYIDKLSSLPWSSFTFTRPTFPEIIAFYIFIIFLAQLLDLRKNKKTPRKNFFQKNPLLIKSILIASLLFLVFNFTFMIARDRLSTDLRITAIDVGQGSSVLVRLPKGKNILIDGGGFPKSSFDMGKSVIAPFLYAQRINTIHTVVLTHPHPDHLQGLIYITENFNVKEVWSSGQRSYDEMYRQWEEIVKQKKIRMNYLSAQSSPMEINGVRINILWPLNTLEHDTSYLTKDDYNETSLVMQIQYGRIGFLLPADVSCDVENKLIESNRNIQSDVLFAGHHGSRYSSCSNFIEKVGCRWVIFSAGRDNVFRHPHKETLGRFTDFQVKILRTDESGAIKISTDGTNLYIKPYIKTK